MSAELAIAEIRPMFSERRLAEFLDYRTRDGKPNTDSVRGLMQAGKLPPPDIRITQKRPLWKYETIMNWINAGS